MHATCGEAAGRTHAGGALRRERWDGPHVMKILIDTEQVIAEVQKRPVLWDKRNVYYKSREGRETAWREILLLLIPESDGWSDDLKREADKKIQQRWRTARDTYQKDKIAERYGYASDKKRRKYAYYDLLTFLNNAHPNNGDEVNELSEESNIQVQVKTEPETIITTSWSPPKLTPKPNRPQSRQIQMHHMRKNYTLGKLRKKRQPLLESEDLAFFESLQPTLKSFNRYQKLMFRTKVLNVAMEMESQINHRYVDAASTSSSRCTDYPIDDPSNMGLEAESEPQDYKFITVEVGNELGPGSLLVPREIGSGPEDPIGDEIHLDSEINNHIDEIENSTQDDIEKS